MVAVAPNRRRIYEEDHVTHHDVQGVAVELDLSMQTRHFTAHLTTREHGVDAVVDLIFNTYRDGNRGRPPQAQVCPAIFSRPEEFPDNVLRFDLDVASGIGAMMYTACRPGCDGTWVSRGVATDPQVWLSWDDDLGAQGRYPPEAAVPMSVIRQAVHELHDSRGERPTCVNWQRWPEAIW
jgi:hypothetical protein